jgi:tetratricopeptide (TPR) repeat protein
MPKRKPTVRVQIPILLADAVKNKRAILFLGAGASKEAKNAAGQTPPDADQLRDILAQRFFGRPMKTRDVMAVAEMAIASSGGLGLVFHEVRQAFEGFQPSEAHKLISAFNWRAIATTNYDLLVEKAYSDSPQRLQTLVPFVKDDQPIEEKLQAAIYPVQYLKLHGCLLDSSIPLILSRESYASYSSNRTRLFDRLKDYAHESAVIFVGYRLDDPHIRDLLYKIDSSHRPRWYIVTPDAEDYDIAFWGTKNIEVLKLRFGEFIRALDAAVPPLWRKLLAFTDVADFPVRKFFVTNTLESDLLRVSLATDLTFVHAGMPYADQLPQHFYEGYDTGWGGIIRRFDVRRKVEEDLMFKVLLEQEKPTGPLVFILRGPGGAGKTIALKRTAFEAATASDALVLWLEENGALRPQAFIELYELTKRPIYLFVDQMALHVDKLQVLLKVAASKSLPLIVVGAERDADWSTYGSTIHEDFSPKYLRVGNLSITEIEGLLDLLDRHDCLGLLKEKRREDQVKAFAERADRQLLVALHELTQGKPFEEIILAEHQRVYPEQARQLYLDIATMHQFAVKVRAGTISRISGIEFHDYKERFFEPLKNIVSAEDDPYSDYVYRTRHPRVATLVYRQVCPTDETKARQFIRLIDGLDIGYSSDKRALEEITRGRALAETFAAVEEGRAIYERAISIAPTQAFLHQQWALFETHHTKGSAILAEEHASTAHELDPRSNAIRHTQVETDRRRANEESSPILKDTFRRRARTRLNEMPSNDRFVVSSRCKLLVDEVFELSRSVSEDAKPHEALFFAEKVKDAEDAVARAQQQFPDDADIIQVEAHLRDILDQENRALSALERAWTAGPRGSGTALRIAQIYLARGRSEDAHKVLMDALNRNPDDKSAHRAIAIYYLQQPHYDQSVVENHLRKSFSSEDHNFEERYMLAQFLFLKGDIEGATALFDIIDRRAPESFRRAAPRKESVITSRLPRYTGMIESMKEKFLFIKSGSYPRHIFAHYSDIDPDVLEDLSIGQEVNFRMRFSRQGATAADIRPTRS